MRLRPLSWSLIGLLASAVIVGLCLPRRSEVSRSRVLPAPPEVVHGFLAALPEHPDWCTWEPGTRPSGPDRLRTSASIQSRGVWFDVPSATGVRQAALLLEPVPGGTRVEWFDVLHLGLNPLGSLWALTRERRVGAQMEESLEALRRRIAD